MKSLDAAVVMEMMLGSGDGNKQLGDEDEDEDEGVRFWELR